MKLSKEACLELGKAYIEKHNKYPVSKHWTIATSGCSRDRVYENWISWPSFIADLRTIIDIGEYKGSVWNKGLITSKIYLEDRKCLYCKNIFNSYDKDSKYCSKECYVAITNLNKESKPNTMSLYEALILAFDYSNYKIPKNTKNITKEVLLEFIASRQSTKKGALGYSIQGWVTFIKKVFPDKPKNTNYYEWLLIRISLKYCNTCNFVKPITDFWHTKNNTISGAQSWCVSCFTPINRAKCRSTTATYRARKLQAIPLWAELIEIKKFYDNCPEGYHVDHIYPLAGKTVCGLHVLNNLQYLSAVDNLKKYNKLIE